MTVPRLLDLFCGAGGCSVGYHRAGFEVVGVDIAPQPRYPFEFHQADALTFPLEGFGVVHASPPCQAYSWAAKRWGKEYPDLVAATRARIQHLPHIIENVVGAPLRNQITLCGEMFGLNVIRHRLFECDPFVLAPPHKPHRPPIEREARDGSARTVKRSAYCTVAGHGGESSSFRLDDWQAAMEIDWMEKQELTQAIPPAYTEYIGKQLLAVLA